MVYIYLRYLQHFAHIYIQFLFSGPTGLIILSYSRLGHILKGQ